MEEYVSTRDTNFVVPPHHVTEAFNALKTAPVGRLDLAGSGPSLSVALHVHPGVQDLIRGWIGELDARRAGEADCADFVDLAAHRDQSLTAARSLLASLSALLGTTAHDGPDLALAVDATTGGLFFRYHRSGYHGGLVRHVTADAPRWQIHT